MKKIRVAVVYGGRSGEHEVSLLSASSVIQNLDPDRFEIIPVSIDKDGRWRLNDLSLIHQSKKLSVFKTAPEVMLPPVPAASSGGSSLVSSPGAGAGGITQAIDVVFPVMHGTNSEDGVLQGFLEMADVPYVGCGVLASAVGMDKDVAKRLVEAAGIAVTPWVSIKTPEWKRDPLKITSQVSKKLGYPVFVKPSNSGSSVGVTKVAQASDLEAAVNSAFQYDTKVLIEKGVNAREIEFSVLESLRDGEPAEVSVAGEIIPTHEFYSYEAKYLDEAGAGLKIPAELSTALAAEGREMARTIFQTLECEGMARVDLFLDKDSGRFIFNEINTIPGFTKISMYPKLWEASGLSYANLLSHLIELALKRHKTRGALIRDFSAK